ncbi:MAG: hypothetical protein ABSD29_06890 [Verrucomicrobiota bacterium]|jgi:hypothetical protein
MKLTTKHLTALLAAMTVVATGCTATLNHGKFSDIACPPKGPVGVSARAEKMPHRIGWGTFTVFAIPVAPVTVNGEPDKELMNQFKAAVEHCGYQAKLVQDPGDAAGLPVLSCSVKKFKFRNYTWLFPLVFNWGTVTVEVSVKGPDGTALWSKSYNGKASGLYSFNSTVNKALTVMLNEMIADLARTDFKAATGAKAPPAANVPRPGI